MSAGVPTVTEYRLRLLTAAAHAAPRLYREAGQVWLSPDEVRVTVAAERMCAAGWLTDGRTVRPGKVALAPTPEGRAVLSAHGRCGRCGQLIIRGQARAQCQHTMVDRGAPCPAEDCPVWDVCPACWERGA